MERIFLLNLKFPIVLQIVLLHEVLEKNRNAGSSTNKKLSDEELNTASVGNFTPCTVGSHASTQSTYGRRRGTVTGDSHVDVSVVALKLQTSLSALRKVRAQL